MKRLIGFLSALVMSLAAAAADRVVHLAPDGDDRRDGSSPSQAVGTLQRAVDLAIAPADKKQRLGEASIRVADGVYPGQMATLHTVPGGPAMVAIVRADEGVRPRFEGTGSNATWLTVSTDHGAFTGLLVFGLEVNGFSTAITLNGSRDEDGRNVSDVIIRNNAFRQIGQYSPKQTSPSTAVIRLVNADRVQIVNNRFDGFRNRERCGLIHAIYLAHGSTDNVVEGNHFEDGCGDAIRSRDASGGNRFIGNTFVDAWDDTPISDWFCDSSARKDCTKKTPECPSFANEVARNRIETRRLPRPEPMKVHGPDSTPACPSGGAQGKERKRYVNR